MIASKESSKARVALVGTVGRIVRYPVKSMRGEAVAQAELIADGVAFDRLYAFESVAAPVGMLRVSGRERRELLRFTARYTDGKTVVETPDGDVLSIDDPALIVRLPAFSTTRLTFQETPQTDCRPLSLISLQTIERLGQELGLVLDPRRFRANLYLNLEAGFAEDAFVGKLLQVGQTARIRILERDPRCRFITLDPETTEPIPELMSLLHRRHQGRAGIYASIANPGTVAEHDPVYLLHEQV